MADLIEESDKVNFKSFLEDVLKKSETLISEDHPATTSDLLLHIDLLEKSVELLQISRETNGWTCQSSQSNDDQTLLDLENVFSDIHRQFNFHYMNESAKSMLCTISCPTVASSTPGRPRYDIPQETLEELRSMHFTWNKIAMEMDITSPSRGIRVRKFK